MMLTLAAAATIIEEAFIEAGKRSLKPLTIVVLDPGGHPIALQRQDGSSILRPEIAIGKAAGALALGVSSRKIGEMATERPTFIASVAGLAPRGVIPAAGGVIILDAAGAVLGAIGVTGDTSDNDEACALAGIEAAGLQTQD